MNLILSPTLVRPSAFEGDPEVVKSIEDLMIKSLLIAKSLPLLGEVDKPFYAFAVLIFSD